ncbi:hypothetical protein V1477_018150 [Vespula maculifrons]|uniref:Uncharacterized protein n=1 Tax=Vespula maculifrons TaxID=7453 RepID=A0ABD2AYN4_VESMC
MADNEDLLSINLDRRKNASCAFSESAARFGFIEKTKKPTNGGGLTVVVRERKNSRHLRATIDVGTKIQCCLRRYSLCTLDDVCSCCNTYGISLDHDGQEDEDVASTSVTRVERDHSYEPPKRMTTARSRADSSLDRRWMFS